MAKKMLIDATHAEETRVVVVDGNKVEEFDFESENKRQLAGNIYLAKVTRVEPSLQAAFVDYGGNRHGFLAFSEIHPDYYQIPVADREALMEEERAYAEAQRARDEEEEAKPKRRSRSRSRSKAAKAKDTDAVATAEVSAPEASSDQIEGMETIDLDDDTDVEVVTDAEASDEAAAPSDASEAPVADDDTGTADDAAAVAEDAAVEQVSVDVDETAAASESDASAAPTDDDTAAVEGEAAETETADVAQSEDVADTEAMAEADATPKVGEDAEADDADADDAEDDAADDDGPSAKDAASKDDSIESVADDDDHEDIRPVRKPRMRRYKIQEVIKVRQILLVQVVKEERGNKGAALTTYLSLAGRYCVLMPNTARGGGISRKITNAADRKKLKEIAGEIEVPSGAGLIVRTAGAKRTKAEIKRDYEYLQRLWEQIRELTLQSIAPAKIYEEGDLIKRSIRDLYNREIEEVLVEGERGYRNAKDFMKMIMPSHAKNVKHYQDGLPLFARYQVETYLAGMFNPTVQLRSGGYIVIGVTEALVAVDVNSGRATKEGSIEETALKTNLEAAEEVARQLRLRDLAGLIVIDFIDMDERKNNTAVEKRLKDKLKTDRARIQVGRISGFGLLEMSRQRLRPGMLEASTQPCPHCHGTGLIRSDDSMALSIVRQIEEEGTRRRSREVLVKCPVDIANFLMNSKREHIAQIEGRYGLSVRIEGDPMLVSPDFSLEKFKTATRTVVAVDAPVVVADATIMADVEEEVEAEDASAANDAMETGDDENKPKRRRRRRRRRRPSGGDGEAPRSDEGADASTEAPEIGSDEEADKAATPTTEAEGAGAAEPDASPDEAAEGKSKRGRRSRSSKPKADPDVAAVEADGAAVASADAVETAEAATEQPKPKRKRAPRSRKTAEDAAAEAPSPAEVSSAASDEAPAAPEPAAATPETEPAVEASAEVADSAPVAVDTPASEPAAVVATSPEPVVSEPAPEPEPKPKRRGWWSLGSK